MCWRPKTAYANIIATCWTWLLENETVDVVLFFCSPHQTGVSAWPQRRQPLLPGRKEQRGPHGKRKWVFIFHLLLWTPLSSLFYRNITYAFSLWVCSCSGFYILLLSLKTMSIYEVNFYFYFFCVAITEITFHHPWVGPGLAVSQLWWNPLHG